MYGTTTHIDDAPRAVAHNVPRAIDRGHVEHIIDTSPVTRSRHGVRVPDALPHLLHAHSPVLSNSWICKKFSAVVAVQMGILAERSRMRCWRVVGEIKSGIVNRDDIEWASVRFGLTISHEMSSARKESSLVFQ